MFNPIQIITFCKPTEGSIQPSAPQYAGVQGDNGRTRVDFIIPEEFQAEGNVYRVEVVTGGGSLVTGELLTPQGTIVSQVLTRPFTEAGGRCTVRLIVTALDENGDEQAEVCAMAGHLYFEDRPSEGVPAIKHGISEMLHGISADASSAERSASEAKAAAQTADECQSAAALSAGAAQVAATEAADTAAQMSDLLADFPNRYAPIGVATTTNNPASISRCAAGPIVDLIVGGNSYLTGTPSRSTPVSILTGFQESAGLVLSGKEHRQSVSLAGLNLQKWDSLFRDTDGLWKIRRGTQTVVYNGNTNIYQTADRNDQFVRYQIGEKVFDINRQRDEGFCTHLPRIVTTDTEEGVLFGYSAGSHINIVLSTAEFPTVESVQQWFEDAYRIGKPVMVKFRSDHPTVHPISDGLQEKLQALYTEDGTNMVEILNETPSTLCFKAAVAASERRYINLNKGETYLLSPGEDVTAFCGSQAMQLYTAGNNLLASNFSYCRCVCTEQEENGNFSALVNLKGDSEAFAMHPLSVGAYLKANSNNVHILSQL